MITISDLQKKWDDMNSNEENYLMVSGSHPLSVHIGYNSACQRSFVVYYIDCPVTIPSSNAVSAVCTETLSGKYSLSFSLIDSRLKEVFTTLCWDLIFYSDSKNNALSRLIERYAKWQKLLQEHTDQKLGIKEIKGLIGELFYLSACIDEYGENVALSGWIGSNNADQDFVFDDKWVDVKTTKIDSSEISISSLQQLDRRDSGYLVVYFMDESSSEDPSAYSLKNMIEYVEDKLASDEDKDRLWSNLVLRRCAKSQINEYCVPRFHVARHSVYRVDDGFPRLTRANVPVEISAVKYKIALSAIENYKI